MLLALSRPEGNVLGQGWGARLPDVRVELGALLALGHGQLLLPPESPMEESS